MSSKFTAAMGPIPWKVLNVRYDGDDRRYNVHQDIVVNEQTWFVARQVAFRKVNEEIHRTDGNGNRLMLIDVEIAPV